MKDHYQPPLLRSILLGILAFFVFLAFFGFLGEITKWFGQVMYFLPDQVGLVDRVSQGEVIPVLFERQETEVLFPGYGQYQLYTNDYDLLVTADTLAASDSKGWLVIRSADGQEIPVEFISRGLAPFDTPFAGGRPIYTFYIPESGTYTLAHPARPITVYLTPDVTTGREGLYRLVLEIELAVIAIAAAAFYFLRRRKRERPLRERRKEQRARADEMFERDRKRKNDKPKDRWSDF